METESSDGGTDVVEMFKSYYVVWKHKGVSAVTKSPASLNRTM